MKKRLHSVSEVLSDLIPFLLGFLSSLISVLDYFSEEANFLRLCVNLILLALLLLSYSMILKKRKLSSGLTLLAKDGHIHTTRMLILRDNFKEIAKLEHNYEDITKQNDFHAQNVKFSFHVKKNNCGFSDIVYHHYFTLSSLHDGEKLFAPWFFGEDEAVPTNCFSKINNQSKLDLIPKPIIDGNHDYAANEGIYTTFISLGRMRKNECKNLDFCYERKKSFRWDREEIFVIWPKCFATEMSIASFSVTFEDNVSKVVSVVEYICHGNKPTKQQKAHLIKQPHPHSHGIAAQYSVDGLDIDADNVYVIYITDSTS